METKIPGIFVAGDVRVLLIQPCLKAPSKETLKKNDDFSKGIDHTLLTTDSIRNSL